MTSLEFKDIIKRTKRKKAVKFSIIAGFVSLIGIIMMAVAIFDKVHTKAPISAFVAGLLFFLMGLGVFLSLKDKSKILTINNGKSQTDNLLLLSEISKIYDNQPATIKDNYFKLEPKRKWFKNTLEIQALALDQNIQLSVDAPGTQNKGVISFGAGRRNRKLILEKLKSA